MGRGHYFSIYLDGSNGDECGRVIFEPAEFSHRIVWEPLEKRLTYVSVISLLHLPYFEPDLSDWIKTLDKIKTYVLFS